MTNTFTGLRNTNNVNINTFHVQLYKGAGASANLPTLNIQLLQIKTYKEAGPLCEKNKRISPAREPCLLYLLHLILWPQLQTNLRENTVRCAVMGKAVCVFHVLFFFYFKVMQLVYSPVTSPAYYLAPAATRRQARVFMASIKKRVHPLSPHNCRFTARLTNTLNLKRTVQFV